LCVCVYSTLEFYCIKHKNSGEPNQYRLLTTVFNLNREHLEDPVTKVGSAVSIAKNVGTGRDANP
jgi:hypothetical protein